MNREEGEGGKGKEKGGEKRGREREGGGKGVPLLISSLKSFSAPRSAS